MSVLRNLLHACQTHAMLLGASGLHGLSVRGSVQGICATLAAPMTATAAGTTARGQQSSHLKHG